MYLVCTMGSAYVVLSCLGTLGRVVEGMMSDATVAKERVKVELRREVWRAYEERATFMSGQSRGIEGADTVLPRIIDPAAWTKEIGLNTASRN
jgi:hypothetical protein